MNAVKAFALIPAAGMGKRMGASINKQYLLLDGRPILAHTLSVFEKCPLITGICLVTPADEIPYCREEVVKAGNFSKVIEIVPGGKERQNSVMNGLVALERHASAGDVILIHDGVRPFISADLLQQSIDVARSNDGALVAVPAKDTIKTVINGIVVDTPARETLWQAQTPQSFRFSVIHEAHRKAELDCFLGTDDASLVERSSGKVRIVRGDYHNIKITTPEDLVLAEAFLAAQVQNGAPS
ncbi:2-C-methyl-D-erythritol 4-phosphate cytidylyltransferase [Pelotalea chapellei]|uniref:2-C-methyl-D-erythritol 4-phosphate cytidylyltransferase n=1 Tax=Pelotalea chapellei TaxID=44671 RepID=A0ABS5U6N6_9BACT|nr:2-C-methyl-D-erythritol 4-phosphate cytidylyltransferase [Pelotalea chapellei]MBT1071316.1 2-C-methyl-D-erythritol 4-phosphate cytidylyltransferase [Pelotalea chapellei]